MSMIQALILGLISGITSFLPVSSSGQLVLIGTLMGISDQLSLKYLALMHVGTLLAVVLACYPDIVKLLYAFWGIIKGSFRNLRMLLKHLLHPDQGEYHPVIRTVYGKMAIMLLLTTAVTVVISLLLKHFAEPATGNLLAIAVGFFVTALILLISSYTAAGQRKPSKTRYTDALLIGVFQGFSGVPGVSRFGMVLSGASFAGFSRKYKIEYALLTAVPAIVGGMILEWNQADVTIAATVGILPMIFGIISAAFAGYFTIRFVKRHFARGKWTALVFAVYGAVMGICSIVAYFG